MSAEQYLDVPLNRLRLDPQNPRLPRDQDWSLCSEPELLKELYLRYNLIELANSMADKGFKPRHAEALLVVATPETSGEYMVVEGNRRLATLKLLTSAELRRKARVSPQWHELAEKAKLQELDPAPVIVYGEREELDDYLGFRHITGPTPWRPEAKARFIDRLLGSGESIGEVARRIGSNHRTVRRYAEAHAVYSQALEQGMDMDQVEKAFGVFYNALDQAGIRQYLGLGKQSDINTRPENPIPNDFLDNLRELISLLYGDEERSLKKVITESRELRELGEVLLDERGRASLLSDRDLSEAYRLIGGGHRELIALLNAAYSRLAQANGQAREFRDDAEIREEVARICRLVMDMRERFQLDSN